MGELTAMAVLLAIVAWGASIAGFNDGEASAIDLFQQTVVERGLAQHDPATGVVVWLDDGTPVFMEDGE